VNALPHRVAPDSRFYRGLGFGLAAAGVMWAFLVAALYYLV
jgi:hypothetical protein